MAFVTVPNGMKLTCMGVPVNMVPAPGLVEQTVLLGASFFAAGFEAIGAIRDEVVANSFQQLSGQAPGLGTRGGPKQERKQVPQPVQGPGETEAVQVAAVLAGGHAT